MSRIVITGASSGLGLAIKCVLDRRSHDVIGFSYPDFDVKDFAICKDFMQRIGPIDVLINCAGVSPLSWIDEATDSEWENIMDTNCKGIFNMARAAIPFLSGGTILNIGSTAAWTPMTCTHIYNASKAAVHMMTRQMARELKPRHGIDVFAIAPNVLEGTGISESVKAAVPVLRDWTTEEAAARQAAMIPNGVPTPPRVVAEFIAYLLQDKEHHKYLTGCIVPYGA